MKRRLAMVPLFLATMAMPQQPQLTLQQAEQLALRNNPSIAIAKLTRLIEQQQTREVRSAELPTVSGNITAVDSHSGSRIAAGGLTNPIIFPRAAGGVSVAQLFTDFGRTRNLVASAKLQEQAARDNERATAAEITFAVDQAFFHTLNAQELVRVAEQTVNARQTTVDQITALATAKLRSDLDRSFAEVNLEQARLLLLDAQDAAAYSMAALNNLMGNEAASAYQLQPE